MSSFKALLNRAGVQRGQTLIEFAFIAPIMFLFLFVIVDFGIAMDRRIVLQHAVREGARYAAVTTDCAAIQARTEAQAQGIIDVGDVTVSYEHNPAAAGDNVSVKAHFTYQLAILDTISDTFGVHAGSIDMSPSASARLELTVTDAPGCGPTPTP